MKATRGNDYYLTITESKRRIEKDGRFAYDKHKIFLYKEDFEKFAATLQEMVDYIRTNCPAASPSQTEGDGEENTGPYKSDITFDEL